MKVYAEYALAERVCQKWFARASEDFGLEDEEPTGQPKMFVVEQLEA